MISLTNGQNIDDDYKEITLIELDHDKTSKRNQMIGKNIRTWFGVLEKMTMNHKFGNTENNLDEMN
jgi:hypothetical protein